MPTVVDLRIARRFVDAPETIDISRAKGISESAALMLAECRWIENALTASGSRALPPPRHPRIPRPAPALLPHKGTLHFPNLKRIPVRIATILAGHRGHLEIEIHSGLPEKTLLALIRHRPAIRLDNLTSITPTIARALAQRRINHLCEGLAGDFEEGCQAIADDDPLLRLDGLTHGMSR